MNCNIKMKPLYPWQKEIVADPHRHKLLVVSRRAGKTEVAKHIAVKAILAGQRCLWAAPVHQQVIEIFRSISETVAPLIKYKSSPKELGLLTGGQMWFRSADRPDSLRSLGYDICICDEMAMMDPQVWEVLRPTLAEREGKFLGISSPMGMNFFYDMFKAAQVNPEWMCVQRDWTCCPHLKPEEIAKAEAEMLPSAFQQEFMAQFCQARGALFNPAWLKNLMIEESEWPTSPQRAMISVDLSLGKLTSDWQSIVYGVFHNGTLFVDCHASRMPLKDLNLKVKDLYDRHRPEGVCFETNGFQELVAHDFYSLFSKDARPNVIRMVNTVNKQTRISRLSTLLAGNNLKILNNSGGRLLFSQLSDFPITEFDDTCDATEMCWRAMAQIKPRQG